MATYKPRTTAPSKTDKYYINYSKGGYNTAIVIDSKTGWVMPNCVGYAQGRFREICGDKNVWSKVGCKLAGNAETFYNSAKSAGMKVGQTPKLGAIICWEGKGSAAGHVAVVEEIKPNGDIVCSESGYNAFEFRMQTYYKSKGYLYVTDGSRPLNGFVYQDIEYTASTATTSKPTTAKPTTTTKPAYQCIHTVVKGDTLWALAVKYLGKGSRWPEIQKLNGMTTTMILVGQKLKIPNK